MTRTTLLVLGVVVTAGTVLETAPAAAQGGGRLLSVGSATVVVARSAGHARLAAAPRPPVAPAFRPLPAASKAALLKAAQEIVTAAPPTEALNRVSASPAGVTLVTARSSGVPQRSGPRAAAMPKFSALSAQNRAGILQAIAGDASAQGAAPSAAPAAAPFTLTIRNLYVTDGAWLHLYQPDYVGGGSDGVTFSGGKGALSVIRIPLMKQVMLHFQLMNPSHATYDYSIECGDGTTTRVSAKSNGVQDIVVYMSVSGSNYLEPTLARLTAGTADWYFLGVEVTPM